MKKQFISLFVLTFFLPLQAQDIEEIKSLTMEEVIKMAHQYRPSLKAQQFNTQANKAIERQAIGGYLPQFTLENKSFFTHGQKGMQNQTTFQGKQLVYSFAGPLEEYKMARKGTHISRLEEEAHKNLIRNQVEVYFLTAYLEQEKHKTIEALDKSSQQNINKAKHENELNLLGKNDWLKHKALYAKDLSVVNFYTDEVNIAQKQLEQLTGKPLFSSQSKPTLKWHTEEKIKLKELDEYLQIALKNRPEIKIYQSIIEKEQISTDYYKKHYLPSVGISGDVSKTSYAGSSGKKSTSTIGLSLSWNIFDGTINTHKANQAHAKKLKAIMEKESIIQAIKFEVENAYYSLSKALKERDAKRIDFEQTKNEFELKKQQFELGDISSVAFENARTAWETNQFDWLAIQVNSAIKEKNLFFVCNYAL